MTGRHRRSKISKPTLWIFRVVGFVMIAAVALILYARLFIA